MSPLRTAGLSSAISVVDWLAVRLGTIVWASTVTVLFALIWTPVNGASLPGVRLTAPWMIKRFD